MHSLSIESVVSSEPDTVSPSHTHSPRPAEAPGFHHPLPGCPAILVFLAHPAHSLQCLGRCHPSHPGGSPQISASLYPQVSAQMSPSECFPSLLNPAGPRGHDTRALLHSSPRADTTWHTKYLFLCLPSLSPHENGGSMRKGTLPLWFTLVSPVATTGPNSQLTSINMNGMNKNELL